MGIDFNVKFIMVDRYDYDPEMDHAQADKVEDGKIVFRRTEAKVELGRQHDLRTTFGIGSEYCGTKKLTAQKCIEALEPLEYDCYIGVRVALEALRIYMGEGYEIECEVSFG